MKKAFIFFILFFALQFLAVLFPGIPAAIAYAVLGKTGVEPSMMKAIPLILAAADVYTISLFIKKGWVKIGWGSIKKEDRWKVCLLAVVVLLGFWAPESIIEDYVPEDKEMSQLFASMSTSVVGILSISILGPIAEEVCFRGGILKALFDWKKNIWLAIILSSVLFAVAHGNLMQGVGAALMGILMGWFYYRTGSIIPSILIHIVNNSLCSFLAFTYGENTTTSHLFASTSSYAVFVAAGSVLMLVGIWMANKTFKHYTPLKSEITERTEEEIENFEMA